MTTSFVETDHPRGQAANAGQFKEKANTAPVDELDGDEESDDSCRECDGALDDGEGWDGYCGTCADKRSCAECGDEKGSIDAALCNDCQVDADAEAALTDDDRAERDAAARRQEEIRWGSTNVHFDSRTPWGKADSASDLAPGITQVGTPGHGGVKLSPERNRVIPAALREPSGWYEEDAEINFVRAIFPSAFPRGGAEHEVREDASRSIRNWFPDKWSAWKGLAIQRGESTVRDQQLWAMDHKNFPVGVAASKAESDPDMVVVTAVRDSDGTRGEFLVPKAEYDTRIVKSDDIRDAGQNGRFVVDVRRHPQLPPKPVKAPVVLELIRPHVPSAIERAGDPRLTVAARDRVAKDLSQRWTVDGTVVSLAEILEEQGVTGRTSAVNHGKRSYSFQQKIDGHEYVLPISKATFDYFTDVPDTRSASTIASQDAHVYAERIDRKVGGPTREENRKASEMFLAAHKLFEAEQGDGTAQERDAARRAELAARERAATLPTPTA